MQEAKGDMNYHPSIDVEEILDTIGGSTEVHVDGNNCYYRHNAC